MMLKINLPCGHILPKYFHLEASILAFFFFFFFFFVLLPNVVMGLCGVGKDDFPQANLLQSFLTPQGTISPFTGKGRK